MSTTNPNPFGTKPAPNPSAQSFTPGAVVIAMVLGLILGVIGTLFVGWLTTPAPMALVAQMGTGTTLTAPAGCATGDKVYQLAINGEEGKEVKGTDLAPGAERVTAKARFNDQGHAKDIVVEVSAREGKTQSVISAIYSWTPMAASPGDLLEHQVVRYAVPPKASKATLQDTKVALGKDTTLFVCEATDPDGAR